MTEPRTGIPGGGWAPQPAAVEPGQAYDIGLPGYRDFVLIARSNSSEVYRAQQEGVQRPVAVKVLLISEPDSVARFQRELDITITLARRHPNIVNVIDAGTTATGQPCIVMDYYELGSLQDRLGARGPLPWSEVLAAGTVVADALAFAHEHGLLHRDIKPKNILLLPTSYLLADFGIARPINAAQTSSAEWFSVRHASPQAIDGQPPTVGDDIWSLGSTLFTLLDGRPPFAAEDGEDDAALAYMRRVRTGRPRPLRRPDVPSRLVAIIDRCLRADPAQRHPDAAALRDDLRGLAGEMRAWDPGVAAVAADVSAIDGPPSPALYADTPRVVALPPAAPMVASLPPPLAPPRPGRVAGEDTSTTGVTVAGVMSPSAMANLVASAVAAGGYTTDGTGGYTYVPDPDPRGRATRRPRLGRLLLLGVTGLVLGLAIVVAVRMVGAADGQATASDETADGPTASATAGPTDPVPTLTGPNINNPLIAPSNVEVQATATGALVRWTDTTDGQAKFVVVHVVDGEGLALQPVLDQGTTQMAVARDQLGTAQPPYCFLVIAFVSTGGSPDRGVSPQSCSEPG